MTLASRPAKPIKTILLHKPSLSAVRALIQGSPHPTYVKDLDGRYVLVNAAAAAIFGLRPVDCEGKLDADFLVPGWLEIVRRQDQRVIDTRVPFSFPLSLDLGDGTERKFVIYKWPFIDFDKSVIGIISTARDVTERGERRSFNMGAPGTQEAAREIIAEVTPAIEDAIAALSRLGADDMLAGNEHLARARDLLEGVNRKLGTLRRLERRRKR